MTMLFTHGGLRLSQSLEMVCNAERIAFCSASYIDVTTLSARFITDVVVRSIWVRQ